MASTWAVHNSDSARRLAEQRLSVPPRQRHRPVSWMYPPRPEDPVRAAVDPAFRSMLCNMRMADGRTQRQLAADADISEDHLMQLVNGTRAVSSDEAHALDRALGAGGKLAALGPSDEAGV